MPDNPFLHIIMFLSFSLTN